MKRQLHLASKLCHEFHQDQQLPCQKKSCRLWDEQLSVAQNCTAIQAKQGPHTLQEIADLNMIPNHPMQGPGYVYTKMGARIVINKILEKCLGRAEREHPEWVAARDLKELEDI